MSGPGDLLLFALDPDRALGERIAALLGRPLAAHEERSFGRGEQKMRPLEEVSGRDVYVLHSLAGDDALSANDKLVRLLFFIGALGSAGARSVTAITPYLAYSRKDRRTKPRDPIATRYVAALFEAVGADRIVAVEVHNVAAFENAFRACRPEHVPLAGRLAEPLAEMVGDRPVAVVSPDAGGAKRAGLLRHVLEARLGRPVASAIMEKSRSRGLVSGTLLAGDVAGKIAIIVDDIVASGTTLLRAADACRAAGAVRVVAAAAHGLMDRDSPILEPGAVDALIVSDSVAAAEQAGATVLGLAPLLADVIGRLHAAEPLSDLLPYD